MGYKFSLSRRNDLIKASLFKKMLDDNAEQFFDIFAEGVLEADEQGRHFDFEGDAGSATEVEILSEIGEELKYRSWLPVYSLEAACGPLAEGVVVEAEGWIKAEGCGKLDETMFVVKTKGLSMKGLIPEGAYVILRKLGGGDLEGKTLLIQRNDVSDPESGGAYTIKKFMREGKRVVLKARDSEYDIRVKDDAEYSQKYRAIAEFKSVL